MARRPGWFDLDERYAALSTAGDPLERLAAVVDFELFRHLDAALDRSERSRGGRPPYDAVMMFKGLGAANSLRMVAHALLSLENSKIALVAERFQSYVLSRQCAVPPGPATKSELAEPGRCRRRTPRG